VNVRYRPERGGFKLLEATLTPLAVESWVEGMSPSVKVGGKTYINFGAIIVTVSKSVYDETTCVPECTVATDLCSGTSQRAVESSS
jgi:hypothetical protein